MRRPTFPLFGTAYYPEAWPEAEWRRDLEAMRAAGIGAVRWGEFSWSWWERRDGVFDFAASDRFVRLVGEVGLELILCTPTATPPPWLTTKHPDMLIVDQYGRRHCGGRHYGCVNHQGFLALVERIVGRLAERYRDVPHLVGWQIDNEANQGELAGGGLFDYHPATIAAYRRWLRTRYGTVEALDEAWVAHFWSRGYGDWDEIDPPRPKLGMVNASHWLAWTRFRAENLAGFVAWQRDLLRRVSPGVSVGTNIPDVKPTAMIELGQDYWLQARGLDWAGTDLYAFRKDAAWEERFLAYEIDLMRSALTHDGARFFVMETQSGPHNVPWRMDFVGGHFGPDYLRRCGATYARGGAAGVCWFLWRPWRASIEAGMNGVVDVDGSPTERSRALPAIIAETRALIGAPDRRRRAVLHYSAASIALATAQDPERTPDSAIPGWHALLAEAGLAVDAVDAEHLAARAWSGDDLLVLPYSTALSAAEVAAVRRCVAAGGRVLGGVATGFFDDEGRIADQRPIGLEDLFGARHVACDHLDAAHAWRCADAVITGNVALLEPRGAEVILASDDGRPLLVAGSGGRAVLAAFDLGSAVWNRPPGWEGLAAVVRAAAGMR